MTQLDSDPSLDGRNMRENVSAIIVMNGKVLIGARSEDDSVAGGEWALIGGKVDINPIDQEENKNAQVKSSLIREIKEEIGLTEDLSWKSRYVYSTTTEDYTGKNTIWKSHYYEIFINDIDIYQINEYLKQKPIGEISCVRLINLPELYQMIILNENFAFGHFEIIYKYLKNGGLEQ